MAEREPRCRLCAGPLRPRWRGVVDERTGDRFDVLRCDACSLGATSPVPVDLARYYAGYYGDRHGFTRALCAERRLRTVEAAVRRSRSAPRGPHAAVRLLDVGAGDGSFLRLAARRGFTAVGTELPAVARTLRAGGLDVHDDLEGAGGQGPFEVATAWHTLQALADPGEALFAIRALLAPGAVAIVAVPDAESVQARIFGGRWCGLDVPRHRHHFGRAALARLLAAASLRPRAWHRRELEYDVYGWLHGLAGLVSRSPGALHEAARGRPSLRGALAVAAALPLAPLALGATAVSAAFGRGSTLVVVADAV